MLANDIELRYIVPGTPEYASAAELRYETLYAEWGLPRFLVEDLDGLTYQHLAAFDGDRVVGFARLYLEGGASKIFQVCVSEEYRQRGIGSALVSELVDLARREGRTEVVLDAREHVLGMYERLGFVAEGERFLSPRTHTPHRSMRLVL